MSSNTWKIVVAVAVVVLAGCLCVSVLCLGAAGLVLFNQNRAQSPSGPRPVATVEVQPAPTSEAPSFATPTADQPFSQSAPPTPKASAQPTAALSQADAQDTLNNLEKSQVPINDRVAISQAYKGLGPIDPTVAPPAQPYKVGDQKTFWVGNSDNGTFRKGDTTLRYVGDHVYFWVENGVNFRQSDVDKLMGTFDKSIYSTDRQFFGSEWSPGVDGEARLYVVFAHGLGKRVAGFFSSLDEVPPAAAQYSNGHEMFFLNADGLDLRSEYAYSTLAHEFQHMIHHNLDLNEDTWVNEGFSMLAELLNHYTTGGFDKLFMTDPDLQLNDWGGADQDNAPHYGAAFLYFTYFLDRFGDKATQALVANPDNGMDSVDGTLKALNISDKQTGKPITADDFFADWVVTNFLNDQNVGDGRYSYHNYSGAPTAAPSETFDACPVENQARSVHQYGAHYLQITCKGSLTLDFQGASQVRLIPDEASSGKYFFWSNQGNMSDMTLTHDFDLSAVKGPVSISYRTWYDLEKDYDYVFLSVSEDGGKTWKTIKTPSGTDKNPGGANLGWGYTGASKTWLDETVDLSAYAGKKIQLRFEYLTDEAVNGKGFLLDDVSLPALNYQTDFEKDDGGWTAKGWVRISNALPQTFKVSLIKIGAQKTTVEALALDEAEHGSAKIDLGGDVQQVIVVVSGTTRFTTELANYSISIH